VDDQDRVARAVRAALRHEVGELPPAPAAAVKLLRLTNDERSDVAAISHVIETEPALTAKVLRIVNSAYYGFPRHIRSISRAVTLLGLSAVRQVALHLLFYEGLVQHGGKGKGEFDRLFFWQHSLLVAILSRAIAERLDHPDPDAVYTAGLLHDLGKVILESHGRICYSDFLVASAKSGNPTRDDEKTFFGVSHDAVGAVVCERWELPETVCRVQALHHSVISEAGLTTQQAQEVAMVSLADFIAWTQGIGSVNALASPVLPAGVLDLVPLERLDLPRLLEDADAEITEIGVFYGLAFPSAMQLRANMVLTAIGLMRSDARDQILTASQSSASLTVPHQSLDPEDFVPRTLEALQQEYGFARLLLMQIEPKRRSFLATHGLPPLAKLRPERKLELTIDTLAGDLVQCLRDRRPVLLRNAAENPENRRVLAVLGTTEAAAVPVLSNGRLLGLLWIFDPGAAGLPSLIVLSEVARVAAELGIALERSRTFAAERAKAETDPLTRLANRGALDRFLTQSFQRTVSAGRWFSVGMIDIDHFKRFNDTFGHQSGDDVLRIVADGMRGLTRPRDFLARYGGEEFLFVLLDTDARGTVSYAERIRGEIERRGRILLDRFPGHPLTVSVGVSVYDVGYADPAAMIAAADKALYQAKGQGRNRVVAAWQLDDASESAGGQV